MDLHSLKMSPRRHSSEGTQYIGCLASQKSSTGKVSSYHCKAFHQPLLGSIAGRHCSRPLQNLVCLWDPILVGSLGSCNPKWNIQARQFCKRIQQNVSLPSQNSSAQPNLLYMGHKPALIMIIWVRLLSRHRYCCLLRRHCGQQWKTGFQHG